MPDVQQLPHAHHARKAVPARKGVRRSPHLPGDPVGRREEKGGVGWGGLLVGAAGSLFVAYVWNVGGLHTTLDELFGGWNQTLRTHDEVVAKWYLAALPVLGIAFVAIVLYWMLSSAAGKVNKARKRRKKRIATPAATVPASSTAAKMVPSASGMDFVRPVRLAGARDESVLVKTQG